MTVRVVSLRIGECCLLLQPALTPAGCHFTSPCNVPCGPAELHVAPSTRHRTALTGATRDGARSDRAAPLSALRATAPRRSAGRHLRPISTSLPHAVPTLPPHQQTATTTTELSRSAFAGSLQRIQAHRSHLTRARPVSQWPALRVSVGWPRQVDGTFDTLTLGGCRLPCRTISLSQASLQCARGAPAPTPARPPAYPPAHPPTRPRIAPPLVAGRVIQRDHDDDDGVDEPRRLRSEAAHPPAPHP